MENKNDFDPGMAFVYKSERPWPVPRLRTAAIIGHTTATTSKIWLRTGAPGDYWLLLCPNDQSGGLMRLIGSKRNLSDGHLAQEMKSASASDSKKEEFSIRDFTDDTTHVCHVKGLREATLYNYWLFRKNTKEGGKVHWQVMLGADKIGQQGIAGLSFRTLSEEPESFSFALFSCHNPFIEEGFFSFSGRVKTTNMDAWAALAQTLRRHAGRRENDKRLAFIIAGGDQVYTDGRPGISIWKYLYRVMGRQGDALVPDEASMLTWFRDIFRGYWGFPDVREVYAHYPTYMIWDDHEIGDGWGSFDAPNSNVTNPVHHPIYEKASKKGLSQEDAAELLKRMFRAAREAYIEYEHSHNPSTKNGKFHYDFSYNQCGFFVLDGRGQRDVSRKNYRISGESQIKEFIQYASDLNAKRCKFLFVTSAVPLIHITSSVVDLEENKLFGMIRSGDRDDLRDGWEHSLHDEERRALKKALWGAAAKGIRVAILSGDVHASACFRLRKQGIDLPIYQLTSSAITYHLTTAQQVFAKHLLPAAEDGETADGEQFTRLTLSVKSPYSIVQVEPKSGKAIFQMYSPEPIPSAGSSGSTDIRTNSTARIELWS